MIAITDRTIPNTAAGERASGRAGERASGEDEATHVMKTTPS
jgi:hypothetical protein